MNQRDSQIPIRLAWFPVTVAVLALSSVTTLTSCQMPELTHVSNQAFPRPMSCSECHVEIYEEWEHSPHASAFVSEQFRRATDDYRFTECLGCHTPQPGSSSAEPVMRTADQPSGVACVSCHLDNGAMVGPLEPTGIAKPHPIRVDPALFNNGTLCGRCHGTTLAQWQSAQVEEKQDCRHCHMPEVTRKITQATSLISRPIVAAETKAVEHRHVFSLTPADLVDGACQIDIRCTPTGTEGETLATIALRNRVPHDLPTGDFGVRIIEVAAIETDEHGREELLNHWELTRARGSALGSGQSREWTAVLPRGCRTLRVEVSRLGRDRSDRTLLLRQEVNLP